MTSQVALESTGIRRPQAGWLFVLPWDLRHAGGVNEVVRNLYQECRDGGEFSPILMVADWSEIHGTVKDVGGRHEVRLRLRPAPDSLVGLIGWLVQMPGELIRLVRLLRREAISVVNVHYPSTAVLAFVILRRLCIYRGAIMLSFHGSDVRAAMLTTGLARVAWRLIQRGIDAAVTVSANMALVLTGFFGAMQHKIVAIHNGIDAQRVEQLAAGAPVLCADARFFLSVGTFDPIKGQDVLLRAFAQVATSFSDLRLHLVGRDAPFRAALVRLAQDLGIADRVQITCDLDNASVLRLMRRASAFVLPSRSEGFPITLLEAGALGVPVVATRVGGVPELVESGHHGVLVKAEDVDQLAAALRQILVDTRHSTAMGEALRKRVRDEFTWDRAFERLAAIVVDVGGRTPGHPPRNPLMQ